MTDVKHTTRPFITKLIRTSITLDKSTESLAMELKKTHYAGSMSSYVKGLIALDALQTKGPMDLSLVPAWVVVAYRLDVSNGVVQPPRKSS
jgi:hypothetical protein